MKNWGVHAKFCAFRWLDRLRTAALPHQLRSLDAEVVYLGTCSALRPETKAMLTPVLVSEMKKLCDEKPSPHTPSCLWAMLNGIVHSHSPQPGSRCFAAISQPLQQAIHHLEYAVVNASASSKQFDLIMKVRPCGILHARTRSPQ